MILWGFVENNRYLCNTNFIINQKQKSFGKNLEMVWQERQDYACHAETNRSGGHRYGPA